MIKLQRPVKGNRDIDWRVTQLFWENPKVYNKFWLKGHNWIDYAWPKAWDKVEIYSPIKGKVVIKQFDPEWYGNYLRIETDVQEDWFIYEITLWHFDSILNTINVGSIVDAGSLLGIMWTTWHSTWVHLHMWVRRKKWWAIDQYNNWYKWSLDFATWVVNWPKSEVDQMIDLWITNWDNLDKPATRKELIIMLYRLYKILSK